MTTPGAGGEIAQRQGLYKIAWGTTVEKCVDQSKSFKHSAVINRRPVDSLGNGCNINVTNKSIMNTLQPM